MYKIVFIGDVNWHRPLKKIIYVRYLVHLHVLLSVSEKYSTSRLSKECEHMLISHNSLLTYERVHGWLMNFHDFVLHLSDHQNIFYCTEGNL